jgi:hypothetical protein
MLGGPTGLPERETVTEEEDRPACVHQRLDSGAPAQIASRAPKSGTRADAPSTGSDAAF